MNFLKILSLEFNALKICCCLVLRLYNVVLPVAVNSNFKEIDLFPFDFFLRIAKELENIFKSILKAQTNFAIWGVGWYWD